MPKQANNIGCSAETSTHHEHHRHRGFVGHVDRDRFDQVKSIQYIPEESQWR